MSMSEVRDPASPRAGAGDDGRSMILAHAAVAFMMLWPAGIGFVWLWWELPERSAIVAAIGISTLLFCIAVPVVPKVRGVPLFLRWQLACIAILAAVYIYGLAYPAHDPDFARPRAVLDFLLAMGTIAFAVTIRAGREPLVRTMLFYLVAGMLLYLVFFAAFAPLLAEFAKGDWTNSFLPFVNVRRWTNSLAPVAMATVALIALTDVGGKRTQVLLWLAWITFAAVLFWTGGRAPIMAIAGSVVIVGLLIARDARIRLFRTAAIGAVAGSLVSLFLPRLSPSFGFWQRLWEGTTDAASADVVSSGRLTIWRETVELIIAKPWLGYGPNQWALQSDLLRQHGSTHNFPLQVLHDFGLVGGLPAMALVFGTTYLNLRRVPQGQPMFVVVVLMLMVMVLQSFLDSIFYNVANLQIALFTFAMAHILGPKGSPKAP